MGSMVRWIPGNQTVCGMDEHFTGTGYGGITAADTFGSTGTPAHQYAGTTIPDFVTMRLQHHGNGLLADLQSRGGRPIGIGHGGDRPVSSCIEARRAVLPAHIL